ncbi:hypothetical protein M4I32_02330 [Microbacterium sp. LRZ72]|uniref:hypothetical protein n=1 Tax=Microbacterium sp. LRZ72 TaxID=2942481 RepID=UPI0029B7ED13|nr:hypothetical protein [Microbacterium sp. LRZ72]MDX2375634.1 hypothetical protein [Microbacterium sp. LRZ72]
MMLLGLLALVGLPFLLLTAVLEKGAEVVEYLVQQRRRGKRRNVAQIEAELDATEEELRGAVLRLATAMSTEAHEARRAMIRASHQASGTLPSRH